QLLNILGQVPAPLVYLIAAIWIGLESAGIGIPIEPMMLFLGSLAARGDISLPLSILDLAVGCLIFSSLAYLIGRRGGTAAITRLGRYVGLTPVRADHIEWWLRQRGLPAIFLARLTPMVRTFGSFAMGAAAVPRLAFAVGTFTGAIVYCAIWTILGDILGARYEAVLGAFDRFKFIGIAAMALIVAVVVVAHHFWGRLTLHRIAEYFHHHHGKHKTPVTPEAMLR
ncbi:MAG TPA: DedA family protein, partial [Ktedonobacterales bacterium]